MSEVVPIGLATGLLLAALGAQAWHRVRGMGALLAADRTIRLIAAVGLLIGAAFAGRAYSQVVAPGVRLTVIAALAALPVGRRCREPARRGVASLAVSLILAGATMWWALGLPASIAGGSPAWPRPFVTGPGLLALAACAGLAALAFGEALDGIANPAEWDASISGAAYGLLTLLVGGLGLANLWQRSTIWTGSVGESGLAAVWLAWSAAWLGPRAFARARVLLMAGVALLLIGLALVAG